MGFGSAEELEISELIEYEVVVFGKLNKVLTLTLLRLDLIRDFGIVVTPDSRLFCHGQN